jgi:hypothetical protein
MTNEFNKRSGAWAALFAALGLTLAAGCSPREPAAVEARSSAPRTRPRTSSRSSTIRRRG